MNCCCSFGQERIQKVRKSGNLEPWSTATANLIWNFARHTFQTVVNIEEEEESKPEVEAEEDYPTTVIPKANGTSSTRSKTKHKSVEIRFNGRSTVSQSEASMPDVAQDFQHGPKNNSPAWIYSLARPLILGKLLE
ncbi:hypothetical protein DAPPUDRAFT_238212 [Daphnia pulex]|uniref:Uncharacterized protein n=1 Tax=Daphnia pulex TaxID=6669 RepID=E9G5T3_DAPPU|nr:hypothetical protein DAPPUDRAFT_238212 [Daphnia pulex]|eukprot:EFX84819.1 hypothetical protein DAPPUDRAFT_238212 [Daphnia pulex]